MRKFGEFSFSIFGILPASCEARLACAVSSPQAVIADPIINALDICVTLYRRKCPPKDKELKEK